MYGIFRESVVIFRQYGGSGFLTVLYLLALCYMIFLEKETWKRLLFGAAPAALLGLFFLPPVRIVYVALFNEGVTYYRLLWLIPMGLTICYAGLSFSARHRRAGLAVMCALVVLCGRLVYRSPYMTRAENLYHIPQHVIEICDLIAPEEEGVWVRAAVPPEMVYYVRQYRTDILLAFGRDMVEAQWDYYNPVYEAMAVPEEIDMASLLAATREEKCAYLVLHADRKKNAEPEEFGLERLSEIAGYRVYHDPKGEY